MDTYAAAILFYAKYIAFLPRPLPPKTTNNKKIEQHRYTKNRSVNFEAMLGFEKCWRVYSVQRNGSTSNIRKRCLAKMFAWLVGSKIIQNRNVRFEKRLYLSDDLLVRTFHAKGSFCTGNSLSNTRLYLSSRMIYTQRHTELEIIACNTFRSFVLLLLENGVRSVCAVHEREIHS